MLDTKRQRLDMCTRRTKRRNPHLTWKEARNAALAWCTAMWPFDFDGRATPRPKKVEYVDVTETFRIPRKTMYGRDHA